MGAPLDGSAPAQGTTPAPTQQNAPKSFLKLFKVSNKLIQLSL
ncbi:hypothetical protein [Flavobacterium piscinae]|nr:hypothetical protein [Flavobacterium piscinae]